MKKLFILFGFLFTRVVAEAQEVRISTNRADTLPTPSAAQRVISPTARQTESVKIRSDSEVNAESRSKAKTQSNADAKPNPYEKPLTEPASGTTTNTSTPVIKN